MEYNDQKLGRWMNEQVQFETVSDDVQDWTEMQVFEFADERGWIEYDEGGTPYTPDSEELRDKIVEYLWETRDEV